MVKPAQGPPQARVIGSVVEYLFAPTDPEVRFPSSKVDRITPATNEQDRVEVSRRFGVEDRWPVVCEPFTQWVLEDDFVDGRPPLEQVGVQLVADVARYELMKLRLLNAGHQFGGLGQDARFTTEYLSSLALLHSEGARRTVEEIVRATRTPGT